MSLFERAKEKGYKGEDYLPSILEWIRVEKNLYAEIFYSFFHKKWSINSYFIDLSKLKKVERNQKMIYYFTYLETLRQTIDEMLNLI